MMLKLVKKSVTLTECIVGSVILALVFGGLLASFVAARKYVLRANTRLIAVNLGREALNGLYQYVRQDQWDTSGTALYSASTAWQNYNVLTNPNINIDGIPYGLNTYNVRRVAGQDYREVRVNIIYPVY